MNEVVKKIIKGHQQKLLPVIKKYIQDKSLLDVGCGNGFNSFLFNKRLGTQVTLLDIEDIRSKEALVFPFLKLSLEKISSESRLFDVIFLQYILHHLSPKIDIGKSLAKLKRIGKIIIIVEEIISEKTNIQKAKSYDMTMNKIINPSLNNLQVYKYYTNIELKTLFREKKLDLLEEKLLDEGNEENGFLQRKIYILS